MLNTHHALKAMHVDHNVSAHNQIQLGSRRMMTNYTHAIERAFCIKLVCTSQVELLHSSTCHERITCLEDQTSHPIT